MKVLMICGDPSVLDARTESGKRIAEYRQVLGELDVIVCRGNIFSFIDKFLMALCMMWQKKYDVITAQDAEHSFLAWLLSRLHRVPWQMQVHTDVFSPYFAKQSLKNKIRRRLTEFLLLRASGIRVVSERIKKSLIAYNLSLADKIFVLPVFIDTEKIKNAPIKTDLHEKYGKDKFIILMASRITHEKNIGLAVEVMLMVKAQISQDFSQPDGARLSDLPAGKYAGLEKFGAEPLLLIVGNGPEVEKLKRNAPLNVVFEPHTDDLISYYKTCDLFLLTSNYEGYGRTLIEAVLAGAKIISTDVGIADEILEKENIIPVGDEAALSEKLKETIEGKIKPAKFLMLRTKEEYFKLYKESFELCLRK